jgi:hypothetical protein
MVRVSCPEDFGNTHHTRSLAVGMVKEYEVALPHLQHIVSRLIVPYAFPVVGGPGSCLQVVKGKDGWF